MANSTERQKSDSSLIKEVHYRFMGACYAIGYRASEVVGMLNREYGVELAYHTVLHYFRILDQFGLVVYSYFPNGEAITAESTQRILSVVAPSRKKLVGLFEEYCINLRKVKEDPSFGVPYADKRRRVLKLSQNIEELDTPEVMAKGSYPVKQNDGGQMEFESYTIQRKNFTEQRRTIESIGELVDGLSTGDVVINIIGDTADGEKETDVSDSQPTQ